MIKFILILLLSFNLWAESSRNFELDDTEFMHLSSALTTGMTFTLLTWVNGETYAAGVTYYAIAEGRAGGVTPSIRTGVLVAAGGTANAYTTNYATAGTPAVTSSNSLTTTTWNFIANVQSAANARALFLNSTKTTNTTNVTGNYETLDLASIGAGERSTVTLYYDGLIAQSAYFNTALSDAQINEIYLGTPANYILPANCMGYYPLQEASGNALDKSGNGKNMTETSGTIEVSASSPPFIFIPSGGQ